MTQGNDPIVQTVFRQTGTDSYRLATYKEIKEGIYLVHKEGLTKREIFAAMAMQGLCANYLRENVTGWDINSYAKEAIELSDALISALNQEK